MPCVVLGCSIATEIVGQMAADWGIPIITPVGSSGSLGDKTDFSTLTRMSFNYNMLADFNRMALLHFNWTDIAYIYDKTDGMAVFKAEQSAAVFADSKITLTLIPCTPQLGGSERRDALIRASQVSRGMLAMLVVSTMAPF